VEYSKEEIVVDNVKQLLAESKNQKNLMESYGQGGAATIDIGTFEDKVDSLVSALDSTMSAFESGTKSLVMAFGKSVVAIKSAVEGAVEPDNLLPEPTTTSGSVIETTVSEILTVLTAMQGNTSDLLSNSVDLARKAADQEDEIDFDKPRKPSKPPSATKEAVNQFSMPTFKAIGQKLKGFGKGAAKMLGGAAIVVGTVASVYNGFKAFDDDEKISKLTDKKAEAITATDRWNVAVAEGLSTLSMGLLTTKDVFSTVESALGTMRSAADKLFDPETGLFSGIVKSLMDFIETPSFSGVDKMFEELFSSVEKISMWLWDNIVPEPIRRALKGISGAVGGAISGAADYLGIDTSSSSDDSGPSTGMFESIGREFGFVSSDENQMTPMERTKAAIQRRRDARNNRGLIEPATGLAVPNMAAVDKKSSEITKERNDAELRFKAQMAAAEQKSPVVNTTNVNNITEAPKLEIMNAGSMFAGSGL